MTQEVNSSPAPSPSGSRNKRMLVGAGIAFVLITIFLSKAISDPNPEWHPLWMLRPMIIVPLAGATGGLFYHLLDGLRRQGGWKKVLAHFLSLIVYIIGLWMGTVLGLVGTLWD